VPEAISWAVAQASLSRMPVVMGQHRRSGLHRWPAQPRCTFIARSSAAAVVPRGPGARVWSQRPARKPCGPGFRSHPGVLAELDLAGLGAESVGRADPGEGPPEWKPIFRSCRFHATERFEPARTRVSLARRAALSLGVELGLASRQTAGASHGSTFAMSRMRLPPTAAEHGARHAGRAKA
jgi:hypothetical protein